MAVSRFTSRESRDAFERDGIATIAADLLEPGVLDGLPDAPNVLYLAGMKFGSTGDEPSTWAMNAFLPGLVARRFEASRIVALSTANVYPFTRPDAGGAREGDPVGPVGEYAQSCLGRERILEWHARRNGTPVALIRLAYANALTYGVLVDIAQGVASGAPIDLAMGFANVIWQGDANAAILGAFGLCASPASALNLSGAEVVSVRETARRMASLVGVAEPTFSGAEAETALLIDSSRAHRQFGAPTVPLDQLVEWTVAWLRGGGRLLGKPTHFQARDGRF
jgi:nucleoside-diphosphate-sugar epimerase